MNFRLILALLIVCAGTSFALSPNGAEIEETCELNSCHTQKEERIERIERRFNRVLLKRVLYIAMFLIISAIVLLGLYSVYYGISTYCAEKERLASLSLANEKENGILDGLQTEFTELTKKGLVMKYSDLMESIKEKKKSYEETLKWVSNNPKYSRFITLNNMKDSFEKIVTEASGENSTEILNSAKLDLYGAQNELNHMDSWPHVGSMPKNTIVYIRYQSINRTIEEIEKDLNLYDSEISELENALVVKANSLHQLLDKLYRTKIQYRKERMMTLKDQIESMHAKVQDLLNEIVQIEYREKFNDLKRQLEEKRDKICSPLANAESMIQEKCSEVVKANSLLKKIDSLLVSKADGLYGKEDKIEEFKKIISSPGIMAYTPKNNAYLAITKNWEKNALSDMETDAEFTKLYQRLIASKEFIESVEKMKLEEKFATFFTIDKRISDIFLNLKKCHKGWSYDLNLYRSLLHKYIDRVYKYLYKDKRTINTFSFVKTDRKLLSLLNIFFNQMFRQNIEKIKDLAKDISDPEDTPFIRSKRLKLFLYTIYKMREELSATKEFFGVSEKQESILLNLIVHVIKMEDLLKMYPDDEYIASIYSTIIPNDPPIKEYFELILERREMYKDILRNVLSNDVFIPNMMSVEVK